MKDTNKKKEPRKYKFGIFFKIIINQSFNKKCKKALKPKKSHIEKME